MSGPAPGRRPDLRRPLVVLGLLVVLVLTGLQWWYGGSDRSTTPPPSATVPVSASPASNRATRAPSPRTSTPPSSGLPACQNVPKEVTVTVAAVRNDGPYLRPDDDGGTFANREGLLPAEPRGYYREYTVRAPGVRFPGPRRLITGGQARAGAEPAVWFYTADHYASFCELDAA